MGMFTFYLRSFLRLDQGHAHFVANISKMVIDKENITTVIKHEVAYGLSISIYFDLALAYSKGRFGLWNDMPSNILAFLFSCELVSDCKSVVKFSGLPHFYGIIDW